MKAELWTSNEPLPNKARCLIRMVLFPPLMLFAVTPSILIFGFLCLQRTSMTPMKSKWRFLSATWRFLHTVRSANSTDPLLVSFPGWILSPSITMLLRNTTLRVIWWFPMILTVPDFSTLLTPWLRSLHEFVRLTPHEELLVPVSWSTKTVCTTSEILR